MRSAFARNSAAILLGTVAATMLLSCGGSVDQDLVIKGTVVDTRAAAGGSVLAGGDSGAFEVSALGDATVTDSDGSFELYADKENIPAQTLLTISDLLRGSGSVVIDTSGNPPFDVQVTMNPDGSLSAEVSPDDSGGSSSSQSSLSSSSSSSESSSSLISSSSSSSESSSSSQSSFSSPGPEPTATPDPDETPDPEDQDCYCEDGFGPVAPSYICADTHQHPTDCSYPG